MDMAKKTTGLSEAEAVAQVQELAQKAAVKAEESKVKLSDIFRDGTTGKVKLPKVTPRGTALIELASTTIMEGRVVTSIEQMMMVLWALSNQDRTNAKRVFSLNTEEIAEEVDSLFEKIGTEELEEYAIAIEEATNVFGEEEVGNAPKGKARKRKASKVSGS
jgi:hypothetical protein